MLYFLRRPGRLVLRAMRGFTRGHGSFLGSGIFVQMIPLLTAPIIARMYTPSDFGVYAVFFALSTLLSAISTMSLQHSILLEEDDVNAIHAAAVCGVIVLAFSLAILVLILVVPHSYFQRMLGPSVARYLIWLPLSVLISGAFNVLYTWAIRRGRYKRLAINKIILGAATAAFQIGVGMTFPSPTGFVVANLLGLSLAVALLVRTFTHDFAIMKPDVGVALAVQHIRRHRRLAIWTLPAGLINGLAQYLPDLLINRQFGVHRLGQYSLANRMINFPMSFIAGSLQDIFRQQATLEFGEYGDCEKVFLRFLIILSAFAGLVLMPVILLAPYAFPLIFGKQWGGAGELIQAIGFLLIVRFVSSPLSYVWIIRDRQRLDFMWQIGLLLVGLLSLGLPPLVMPEITLYQTLWIYSLCAGTWYVVALVVSYRLARAHPNT